MLKLLGHLAVPKGLIARRKRMQPGEFRPRDWEHLRRCIQLHRAGAERNHRMTKRQVARLESPQVTKHLSFRVMGIENRMSKKLRSAFCELGDREHPFVEFVPSESPLVSPAKE